VKLIICPEFHCSSGQEHFNHHCQSRVAQAHVAVKNAQFYVNAKKVALLQALEIRAQAQVAIKDTDRMRRNLTPAK
jgi:hypothetical protein